MCGPVRLEVLGAVRREMRSIFDDNFKLVRCLEELPTDWDDAIALGRLLKDTANLTLPWLDVLISAIALRNGVRIYTVDDHFTEISRITALKLYEPGPGGAFSPC